MWGRFGVLTVYKTFIGGHLPELIIDLAFRKSFTIVLSPNRYKILLILVSKPRV